MRRLSIIIPNYNYGQYVGTAIESALHVDWPDVEVIVVDDGSTDESWEIISSFGDQIVAVRQTNSGPRVACNEGFARSTGDVVIFLDSDDLLEPNIAREIAAVWRSGISKVQFQMMRIDRNGAATGSVFPLYDRVPSPELVRHWMRSTSAYPTPPGSGNAYSRHFLEKVLPLDDRCGDATDSACLAAAPFLGDVVTVPKTLIGYRVHDDNRSYLLADPARFTKQVERAYQRHAYAQDVCGVRESRFSLRPLFRGRHLLQLRIAEHRLQGGRPPIPTDGPGRMFCDTFSTLFAPGPETAGRRLLGSAWCLGALLMPLPVARRLIDLRFAQGHTASVARPAADA